MKVYLYVALGCVLLSSVIVDAFFFKKEIKLEPCGRKGYDPTTQICCHDQVYEAKTGNEDCCAGWKVYDTAIEQCCYKMIIMKNERCFKPVPSIKPNSGEIVEDQRVH